MARARIPLLALATLLLSLPASAVTIDWVRVGDSGNAADDTGFGAVAYAYAISKFEITNAQYAAFLNAVGASDAFALYDERMGTSSVGGITRSGSDGSFGYATKAGFAQKPVNYVTFYDALRFANWLENGQPTGAQGGSTTEDGSYTITQAGIDTNTVARNPGARIVLTSEDEWYKAAYYDAVTGSYFEYPAGFEAQTACVLPGPDPNTANCAGRVGGPPFPGEPTDVGSYPGSPSPYGTFDQGGNLYELTEGRSGLGRIGRGGAYIADVQLLAAAERGSVGADLAFASIGFRLVLVPEPGTGLLVATGLVALAWRRRVGG